MTRRRKQPMSEINVVPYIDVMLVLLVIFMITAPLLTQGVKVDLPKAPGKVIQTGGAQTPLVVTVNAGGNMFINYGEDQKQPINAVTLVNRVNALLRHKPNTPVMVKGDLSASYGDVVLAMALLQKAGAPSVGLITKPPEGKAK